MEVNMKEQMGIEQGNQSDSQEDPFMNPDKTIEFFKSDPDYFKNNAMALGYLQKAYAEIKDYKNAIKYADKVSDLFKKGYISDDDKKTHQTLLQNEISEYRRLQKEK